MTIISTYRLLMESRFVDHTPEKLSELLEWFGKPEFPGLVERFVEDARGIHHATIGCLLLRWRSAGYSVESFPRKLLNINQMFDGTNTLIQTIKVGILTVEEMATIFPNSVYDLVAKAIATKGMKMDGDRVLRELIETGDCSQYVRPTISEDEKVIEMIEHIKYAFGNNLYFIQQRLRVLDAVRVQSRDPTVLIVRDRILTLKRLIDALMENIHIFKEKTKMGLGQNSTEVPPGTRCMHEGCTADAKQWTGVCWRHTCKFRVCSRPVYCSHRHIQQGGYCDCDWKCDHHHYVIHDPEAVKLVLLPFAQFFKGAPEDWSPEAHWLMPLDRRMTARTVLLATHPSGSDPSPLPKLPPGVIDHLLGYL